MKRVFITIFILANGCSSEFTGGGQFKNNSADLIPKEPENRPPTADPCPECGSVTGGTARINTNGSDNLSGGQAFQELPGLETRLVNISFEDAGDNDYNDVSFCFEGVFKVEGNTVRFADRDEENVIIHVKRLSGKFVNYELKVSDESGTQTYGRQSSLPVTGAEHQLSVKMNYGDRIQARYDKSGDGGFHDLGGSRSRVEIDTCYNSGR